MLCSVHPEIPILKAPRGLIKWFCQTIGLLAGGNWGDSAGKWCKTAGQIPQLLAQLQHSGWLFMHRKSWLFQLRKIITCSKGYIRLLFLSIPTAHLIHGQEYSAIENSNSKKMFRFILLKKFSKLTVVGCQQEYVPPEYTKQLLTNWVVCSFCLSY